MKHLIKGAAAVLAVLALASCDLFAVLEVPESPTGLTATQDGDYIDLVWNAASGAESYKIYAKAPGASSHTYRGISDDTDYTFNPDDVNGTWSFLVAATNANGDSGYSNVATVIAVFTYSEGSVLYPVVLTTSTTPMSTAWDATVGYGTGQYSYYKFVAPYSSTSCYIQISNVSPSSVDLDYFLYSDSSFSSLVASETSSGTNTTWKPNGITRGQTYYLKVKNWTNSANVTFDLRIW